MSLEPLRIATPADLESDHPPPLEQARWRFLCEGDSWFTIGALNPLKSANLLENLAFPQQCWAVNCAMPGDTLSHMADLVGDPHFSALLANRPRRRVMGWDGLLVSAGGNDLIDAVGVPPRIDGAPVDPARRLLRTADERGPAGDGPARHVSEAGWQTFETYLRANLQRLVALRDDADSRSRGVPILMHSYALAVPRPAGAGLRVGPWLWPALQRYGVPAEDAAALGEHLQRRLAGLLAACASDASTYPNLHVFASLDGIGIEPARPGIPGDDGDWVNEIHLNRRGARRFGAAWSAWIAEVMTASGR